MSSTDRLAFGVIVALGLVVRLVPVLSAAAAVGDGGLFLSMIDDIRAAGLSIPSTTSYNELEIPFVYPPLALLSAAYVGQATGTETLDVLRWMPLVVSVLAIVAFGWLAWNVLPPIAAVAATFIYALMPHAYDWVIAGGGVTRGVGLLFALLAMAISEPIGHHRPSARPPAQDPMGSPPYRIRRPQPSELSAAASCRTGRGEPWLRHAAIAVVGAVLVISLAGRGHLHA